MLLRAVIVEIFVELGSDAVFDGPTDGVTREASS